MPPEEPAPRDSHTTLDYHGPDGNRHSGADRTPFAAGCAAGLGGFIGTSCVSLILVQGISNGIAAVGIGLGLPAAVVIGGIVYWARRGSAGVLVGALIGVGLCLLAGGICGYMLGGMSGMR